MAWMVNRWESLGASSTLTLTSFTLPANSRDTCSSAGLTMRQGPHQGAHMSTTTGIVDCSTTSAKSSSPASTTHGSGAPQLPQRGLPTAELGTRFFRPQRSHVTTLVSTTYLRLLRAKRVYLSDWYVTGSAEHASLRRHRTPATGSRTRRPARPRARSPGSPHRRERHRSAAHVRSGSLPRGR